MQKKGLCRFWSGSSGPVAETFTQRTLWSTSSVNTHTYSSLPHLGTEFDPTSWDNVQKPKHSSFSPPLRQFSLLNQNCRSSIFKIGNFSHIYRMENIWRITRHLTYNGTTLLNRSSIRTSHNWHWKSRLVDHAISIVEPTELAKKDFVGGPRKPKPLTPRYLTSNSSRRRKTQESLQGRSRDKLDHLVGTKIGRSVFLNQNSRRSRLKEICLENS